MRYDVIIIGGGLGGLECGFILSRSGRSVLLVEQEKQAGGCLQSYKRNTLEFDTGFHYIGGLDEGQALHSVFKYLGLLKLPWHRLDPEGFDWVTINGATFAFTQGYDNFAAQLGGYFPKERAALKRYIALMKSCNAQQMEVLTGKSPSPMIENLLKTNAWQFLHDNFSDEMLINVLSGTSLKTELRKQSLPLFSFLHAGGSYIESSWRLRGSGSMIADTLISGICRNGGKVLCGTRVEELTGSNGLISQAICDNGEHYEADIFISDIHPQLTCELLKQDGLIRPAFRRRIACLENTFGMFTVSLIFPSGIIPYFNCNHYVYCVENVWDIAEAGSEVKGVLVSCRVPNDGGQYATQIDLLTPMSWSRLQQWSNTTVGHRGTAYESMKADVARQCIALAERVVPDIGRFSQMYTSTPLTWRDYTQTPGGSAYGLRKDCNNILMTMLSPKTPIPNLLLTGQSLVLHGVHGVTMTSLLTCSEIMGHEAIREIVNDSN